jgi:photosystem II stability/assembly factor-like uncharacterized protein
MKMQFGYPQRMFSVLFFISLFSLFSLSSVHAQELNPQQLKQLKFRYVGPVGNRLITVAGIPGDPLTYYVGAASGGIWKTIDGGLHWKSLFNDKPVSSVGSLAIAPSQHQIIYAGTGESFVRSNNSLGDGVWKSTDGGETWKHIGLENTGRISRIVVSPQNPDVVWVAALGNAFVPQKERGIFMTTDGGATWKQVLFVNENTGASDLVIDPDNPNILFAGMWQLELKPWIRISGGPGSGIYKSTDGGRSWQKLKGNGLPTRPVGKIGLAMTPADPHRIYALIETGDGVPVNGKKTDSGELWRSDNLGKSWKLVSYDRDLSGRQAYFTRCAASPDNPNEVYFLCYKFFVSIDGGKTVKTASRANQPSWDHHGMWIDPTNANRMIVVGDAGIAISQNRGKTWYRVQLPVAQLYHVSTDNEVPYHVLANCQDFSSAKGPSRFTGAPFIPDACWHDVGGGESGFATADPVNPDIIWSGSSGRGPLGGIVVRYNEKTKQYRQVEVWPAYTHGHPANDVKYRFQWAFPLLISPHDHNTVYVGSQFLHRTTNGGQSWEVISPDLTLNDKSKQGFSGGLTPDNIGVEYADVIYAIAESPVKKGVIWCGTNDGLVQLTKDNGKTWGNVTQYIPHLPKYGVIRNICASRWNAGKAYISVDLHLMGDFQPYVYKTSDYGRTWKKITNGISFGNLNYVRNIQEDPVRPGLLYLGTENTLYYSFDDGESWHPLMSRLPHVPMYWIDIQKHFNDLVVGTYGRGIWILDDITPLQQLTKKITHSDLYLFAPRPAYRFRPVSRSSQYHPSPASGKNPPYGASLHFWSSAKNDSVKILIKDSTGAVVRTLKVKTIPGINRVWWNLRGKPTKKIIMRTEPEYAAWYPLGKKRIRNSNVKSFSILEPPGTYTVQLTAGNKSFSQKLVVLKDPHSEGTLTDIRQQIGLLKKLYLDMNRLAGNINRIERIRRQLYDLTAMLKTEKGNSSVIEAANVVDTALIRLESKMIRLKTTGEGQDDVRYPARLASRISYLASVVAVADFRPTDQDVAVYQMLHKKLLLYDNQLKQLLATRVDDFLKLLSENDIKPVITN